MSEGANVMDSEGDRGNGTPYQISIRRLRTPQSKRGRRHDTDPVCTGIAVSIVIKEKIKKPLKVPKQPMPSRKRESGNLEHLVDYLRERDEIEDRKVNAY